MKAFYTTTSKQVLDIHEEAKRIAASQGVSGPPSLLTSDRELMYAYFTAPQQHDTTTSPGVGTTAAPIDPAVYSTSAPLAPEGQEATVNAAELKPKTTEAPTVV